MSPACSCLLPRLERWVPHRLWMCVLRRVEGSQGNTGDRVSLALTDVVGTPGHERDGGVPPDKLWPFMVLGVYVQRGTALWLECVRGRRFGK